MSLAKVGERLGKLRERMKNESVDVCLMTSTDFHGSEYVSDYFKVTEFYSGCTSDNVVLVVSKDNAALWTDGRYFISAAKELEGTSITLMRTGEPGVLRVEEYLREILSDGAILAYDARCIRADKGSLYRQIATECGAAVKGEFDAAYGIWEDRPAFPANPLWIMDEGLAGESVESKLTKTKERIKFKGASGLILTKPDEIMWLTNLRGSDIAYNPVALSYMIINGSETILYLKDGQQSEEIVPHLSESGITVRSYDAFYEDLSAMKWEGRVMVDPFSVPDAVIGALADAGVRPFPVLSPVMALKAIKNETELANLREVYLEDSAAVCRFLYHLDVLQKKGVFHLSKDGKETKEKNGQETGQENEQEAEQKFGETDLARELDDMRRTIDGYLSPSFETISAFGENAAIVHYEPKKETQAFVHEGSFLLLDSGGQYKRGTTDITRTVPIGEVTAKMKEHFTYVAVANLRLLTARFRKGCTGANLDSIAREVIWEKGLDYNHGTGHGIGYCLNVHEGPQNISWKITKESIGANTPFEPGMITSDEPGLYFEGEYGIRTESVVECIEDCQEEQGENREEVQNPFGQFLRLRPLTFVPIDKRALDVSLMDESDIQRLDAYHEEVYKKISPLLESNEEREWLKNATASVAEEIKCRDASAEEHNT
jgi:Xaa-Pro aminopeptidase